MHFIGHPNGRKDQVHNDFMLEEHVAPTITRCSSGCLGLDDVLGGGLPVGHFYLIEGEPGTGKTTLALQFVAEGVQRGEQILYVTLSESRDELLAVAEMHGLRVDGAAVFEVRPNEQDLRPEGQYTVFHPAEVELNDRVQTIMAEVDRRRPDRLVIDALSELRMLAKDPLRYRRQVLSLKEYAPTIARLCCSMIAAAVMPTWNCTVSFTVWSRWAEWRANMVGRCAALKLPSCGDVHFAKGITTTSSAVEALSCFLAL